MRGDLERFVAEEIYATLNNGRRGEDGFWSQDCTGAADYWTAAQKAIHAIREHDAIALRKALMPTTAVSHALPASDYQVF